MLGYSGKCDGKNTLDIWYHLLDYVYTAFRHAHMEIPTEPKTIWYLDYIYTIFRHAHMETPTAVFTVPRFRAHSH